jgi:hypothetical protein
MKIPGRAAQRYPERMEQDTSASQSMAELLAALGVVVTPEGRAHARRRLAESRRRHAEDAPATAEFLARLRAGTATTA